MKKPLQMLFIIISGEAIFMLPFLIPRLYRPLMLEAWDLTNTDIGKAFAAYGLTSSVSYLLGGAFADKYNPKILISLSLATTAFAAFYLVISPSAAHFILTYALWGISTVLLMWGALIKTTHVIGGEAHRSTALGVLDSGRGLVAALASSALLLLMAMNFSDLSHQEDQLQALQWIYLTTAGFILFVAVAVWISLRNLNVIRRNEKAWDVKKALDVLKNSQVWLLSVIILSAYCGYKGIDNYSVYLVDVHQLDLSASSRIMSFLIWLRPFSTLIIGFLADVLHRQINNGRFITLTCLLLFSGISQTLLAFIHFSNFAIVFVVLIASVTFVYGLRAVYFSVFGDLKIQNYLVGTTVGVASFVGFLPDVFFGYVSGRLIDGFPGELGFQYTFLFTAIGLFVGALASFILHLKTCRA